MAKSTESSHSSPYRLYLPPADSFFFGEDAEVLLSLDTSDWALLLLDDESVD